MRIPSFTRQPDRPATTVEERGGGAGRDPGSHRPDTVRERSVTQGDSPERERVERPVRPTIAPAPRARASVFATLGLVTAISAALMVLTGTLAGYGVAIATLGLLLSLGGVSATARRHVAGRSDALLGVGLSVGAIVLGGLALSGALSWLNPEINTINHFREWLDTQFVERFQR